MHKKISHIDRELGPRDLPNKAGAVAINSYKKNHKEQREAQALLRDAMAKWSGARIEGNDLRKRQKMFYLTFKIDVLEAQTLNKRDALTLLERVKNDY